MEVCLIITYSVTTNIIFTVVDVNFTMLKTEDHLSTFSLIWLIYAAFDLDG